MSKLIILSNRVSLPTSENHVAGGLAVALQDALQNLGGMWLGWNGERVNNKNQQKFNYLKRNHIEYITCPLTQAEYDQYYSGFANQTLWPAMHHREDFIHFHPEDYKTYQQVNRMFACEINKIAEPDDIIWIHDYHFFSIAHYCRELGMQNRLGFFLHIPFANTSVWEKLPMSREILQHLSQYDVIGLQTENDQLNCIQTYQHYFKDLIIHSHDLICENQCFKVQCYPIGVDPDHIQQLAATNSNDEQHCVFEFDESNHQKTIISVDRVDYSKGMMERFNAFARFLEMNPEYHQFVTDLQIACPCRMDIPEYKNLFEQVKAKINSINHQYSESDWLPINCTHEAISHEQLMKIYRQSDICWVNSLKDGMNLVAKEYIAAQDEDDPGVLILSKHAGCAEQMEDALLVDPQSRASMINALQKALKMPKSERKERYASLITGLYEYDIHHWRDAFLQDLSSIRFRKIARPYRRSMHHESSIIQ